GLERGEPTVVIVATLAMRPQSFERSGAVVFVRRALRLKTIDTDLVGPMHVPAGLGEERRHMATRAVRSLLEHFFTPLCRRGVVTAARRSWRGQAQLIEVKWCELLRHQIRLAANITEPCPCRDGELDRIVQPGIEEGA